MALVQKQFGDLITFTRASAGGRFNSAGVFEMVPANQPRFDFDPVTNLARGILIEEARTNLLLRSAEFDSGGVWGRYADGTSSTVVVANSEVAPDGSLTADKFSFASGGNNLVTQNQTLPIVAPVSLSVWMKGVVGGEKIRIDCRNGSSAGVSGAQFTLTTEWQRYSVTVTTTSTIGGFQFRKNAGDGGLYEFYAWGAQLEAGAFSTSHIPTTTAQATRAADVPSINTLSPWYNPAEGTLYVDYNPGQIGVGSTCLAVYMYSTTPSLDIVAIRNGVGQGNITGVITNPAGATQAAMVGATGVAIRANVRAAMGYKQNSAAFSVNGGSPVVDNAIEMPTPLRMFIGSNGQQSQLTNGHIRSICYYPRRLVNSELQALTA